MNKYAQIILVAIALILLFEFMNDKHGFIKLSKSVTDEERVVMNDIKKDSISKLLLKIFNQKSDSTIKVKNDSIELYNKQYNALYANYRQLRLIAKQLQPVKVDSLNQLVNGLSAHVYNAEINSGNQCDSLLFIRDKTIRDKDSVNAILSSKILEEQKVSAQKDTTLSDYIKLQTLTKKEAEKSKKLNKKIPYFVAGGALGALILRFVLIK
jgi:hypothetical protein